MYINQAKANMAAGQPAVGISCGLQSPVSTEICARLGYDWVMLEQQHWVWDWSLFQHALISIVAGGSVPFARVSRNNVTEIGQALDAGMLGIVVPMVHTAEDARRAGEAVRYPPRGVRSLGATHAQRYGSDYIEWADDQILMMVQIESAQAVANAEAILAEPTVDGCWIGPADMGRSMQLEPDVAGTDAEAAYAKRRPGRQKHRNLLPECPVPTAKKPPSASSRACSSSAAATTANGSAASAPKTSPPPAPLRTSRELTASSLGSLPVFHLSGGEKIPASSRRKSVRGPPPVRKPPLPPMHSYSRRHPTSTCDPSRPNASTRMAETTVAIVATDRSTRPATA